MLRSRQLSAAELTDACLRRIDRTERRRADFDGAPGCDQRVGRGSMPNAARDQAHAADHRRRARRRGRARRCAGSRSRSRTSTGSPGCRLTASSRVLEGNVAARRIATVWQRLRTHGMVLLGHTHTHEFAAGGTTDQVGNPWALDRVVGGSSGGSAAALAARMTPARARHRHVRLAADPVRVLRDEHDQANATGWSRSTASSRSRRRSTTRGRWRARSRTARRCSRDWPRAARSRARCSRRPRRSASCR